MGSDFEAEYFPKADDVKVYASLMESYKELAEFVENMTKSK